MVSAPARREQVAFATRRGFSQRRSCALFCVARSGLGYESLLAARDAPLLERIRDLSAQYPRFGYRRIQVFLEREGSAMSRDRMYRLWQLGGFQVPRKRRRKRALPVPRPEEPRGRNHVWGYDFIFDRCAKGQQLKCLTVVDEWTRESLAIEVEGRMRSGDMIRTLERLFREHGAPRYLRSDNGSEFASRKILRWLKTAGVNTAFIEPGKPWQNGTAESFHDKFRDECLNMEWFRSRAEARVVIETWRRHYNEVRPHSSLDYRTPREFRTHLERANPGAVLK